MNLTAPSNRSNMVSSASERESSLGINERIAQPGHCRHLKVRIEVYGIIANNTEQFSNRLP